LTDQKEQKNWLKPVFYAQRISWQKTNRAGIFHKNDRRNTLFSAIFRHNPATSVVLLAMFNKNQE